MKFFGAALWIINLLVSALLAALRIRPQASEHSQRLTMEELRMLVLESAQFMPKKHQSILVNLFDLEQITVEDVMTPRARIVSMAVSGSRISTPALTKESTWAR